MPRNLARATWVVVLAGIAARVVAYAANRSLRSDEGFLYATIERPLTGVMPHSQAAPFGFLLVERAAFLVLGNSELSLRLFPLLMGVLALVLFRGAAVRLLTPPAALVAIAVLACSEDAIHYTADFKQYSTDVCATAALLFAASRVRGRVCEIGEIFGLGLLGLLALFLSHPSCFVVAGVGIALGADAIRARKWSSVAQILAVGSVWLGAFVLFYRISARMSDVAALRTYWDGDYMPWPPRTLQDALWFFNDPVKAFRDPVGISPAAVGALAFAVGAVQWFRNDRRTFLLITAPIVLALLASGLRLYPFTLRFLLFAVPLAALGIANGAVEFWRWSGLLRRAAVRTPLRIAAAALLLSRPAGTLVLALFAPVQSSAEWRPVVDEVARDRGPCDALFLFRIDQTELGSFDYYLERSGLAARGMRVDMLPPLPELRARWRVEPSNASAAAPAHRAWFFFSHRPPQRWLVVLERPAKGSDEELAQIRAVQSRLEELGRPVRTLTARGLEAICFEFPGERPPWDS